MARAVPIAKAAIALLPLTFAVTACGGNSPDEDHTTETHSMHDSHGSGHGETADLQTSAEHTVAQNGVTIAPAFVRAPRPGAISTAGYLNLTAEAGDKLVSAASSLAIVEVHGMTMENNAMTMFQIEDLDLPAGETVSLAPGGYHLMLINPDAALATMDAVEITLTFEKAGDVIVSMPIQQN